MYNICKEFCGEQTATERAFLLLDPDRDGKISKQVLKDKQMVLYGSGTKDLKEGAKRQADGFPIHTK